jgi:hypothetical protein
MSFSARFRTTGATAIQQKSDTSCRPLASGQDQAQVASIPPMAKLFPTPHVARHLASVLMLLALVLRAAVPQGWMPSADSTDLAGSFTICSVSGAIRIALDTEGNPFPADPEEPQSHPPCAFATLAHLSPPSSGAPVLAPNASAAFAVAFSVSSPTTKARSYAAGARAPPQSPGLA